MIVDSLLIDIVVDWSCSAIVVEDLVGGLWCRIVISFQWRREKDWKNKFKKEIPILENGFFVDFSKKLFCFYVVVLPLTQRHALIDEVRETEFGWSM